MISEQSVLEAKRLGVFTCQVDCLLEKAAAHMVDEDVSALVVVDGDGFLIGIFTRTDLLRAGIVTANWAEQTVGEYMNPNVITVDPETHLADVAAVMLDNHIHRVVVTRKEDGREKPISVVSAADLVYHMVNNL